MAMIKLSEMDEIEKVNSTIPDLQIYSSEVRLILLI